MKNYWTFSLICVLMFGCKGGNTETSVESEEASQGTSASATYATEKFVNINTADNTQLAQIRLAGEEINITTPELSLFGTLKEDKRKYYDQSNTHLYSVKYKDDGFKLRDGGENLLWKIKFKEGKIEIADNEEMTGAFEIKRKEDNRIKVEKSAVELFCLRIPSDASVPVKISDEYLVLGLSYSTAAGVLMLNNIGAVERFVIMAELVKSQQ